ncbi:hypothetical protein DPMN_120541 [Dreissena polymorpha]|uniref:Uncharacterized protein n=1 Tax=Dreissena polymorpha TaxID=45954 RepID=A0A9D4GKN8_DREPO|nr:hypothetical protein DPMN_120541 [Dreissena polymorpha]
MCQISPSEVAVTLNDEKTGKHGVHFITVSNRQLVKGKNRKIRHTCDGIVFYQGDLYITSRTALYKYTLSGTFVSKMYEDT